MKKRFLSLFLLVVLCLTAVAALSSCGEETKVTVTFAGEDISLPAPQTVVSGERATAPQAPEREGYTFLGWFADGADAAFDFNTPITADITLTARFEAKPAVTYTVTFTGEGVSVPAQTVVAGGKVTTPEVPTREGYTFLGWYLGDALYDFDAAVNSDLTLVAKFEAKSASTYTVTFTGEGVNLPAQTVVAGGKALAPKSPTRAGYVFRGWYLEGSDTAFDFDTAITADITLVAQYDMLEIENGTPAHPFLIRTVEDLITFAARINDPSEACDIYRTACYRLEADLDMAGRVWTPAGKTATVTVTVTGEDGEEEEKEREVDCFFSGTFDGNGHTISNLTTSATLRRDGVSALGFFGIAERAYVHDLTLKNISYTAESYSTKESVGIIIGGVAGQADLCTFRNLRVEGVIAPALCAENPAYIGGIIGYCRNASSDGSYISYIQNCSVDLEVKTGTFSDGEVGDLNSAVTGGIAGYVSTSGCAVAVVGCTVEGSIKAGRYTGGVLGYISGSYVSVINCANFASVTSASSAKDATYTAGILAFSTGDNTVMDCYSTGRIKGQRSGSTQYKSYAGGIVGYAAEDDYESYYTAGIAVINCYYIDNITTYNEKNAHGTAKAKDNFTFTPDFVRDTLHWDLSEMVFDENSIARPTNAENVNKTYHITLKNGDSTESLERREEDGVYALLGKMATLNNHDGLLFFDWEHAGSVRYRFYLPVVKDMTLTARFQDSSVIAGIYTGHYTYGEDKDAGTIVLGSDGSVEWSVGSVIRGRYTFDGRNVIFEFYNNYGTVCGIYADGALTYEIDAGMTGSIPYTMRKSNVRFVGSYYSPDGDSLTFSGTNRVSFRSEDVRGNANISGTYTEEDDVLTFSGFSDYFTRAVARVNPDGTLTLDFVSKGDQGKTLDGTAFTKLSTPDYKDKPFLGSYRMPYLGYLSSANDIPSQTEYKMVFEADGTVRYISKYSETLGFYYIFREDTYAVVTLEGYTTILRYDATAKVFYGVLSRGTSAEHNVVLTPYDDGEQKIFVIDKDDTAVLVTEKKVYYVRDGVFFLDYAIAPGLFTDGARVTVDGADYRAVYYPANAEERTNSGYRLFLIGKEEGSYTWGDLTLTLDGIGGVTGTKAGSYRVLSDGRVVVLFDDDVILGFRYADAQAAGNVVTPLTPDRYQGVYYEERSWNETVEDQDGNETVVPRYDAKYYKLVFDGFGYSSFFYHPNGEYRYNWGSSSAWVEYTENGYGVHVEYNQHQKMDFLFYYNGQVAYTKSFGNGGEERAFAKDGYDGSLTPPTLPAGLEGKYTGTLADGVTAVVLNFKSDLSGTYRGTPFSAVYDGADSVFFLIGGTLHCFDITTKVLTYGTEAVSLTLAGVITDVLPAGVCGTWSGTFQVLGTVTVTISANGTVNFGDKTVFEDATYDAGKNQITATVENDGGKYTLTLTWNIASDTLSAQYTVESDETYRRDCEAMARQTA